MKKDSLIQVGIFFGFALLIALGDGIYRHFSKGIPAFVAFHQVWIEYGTLFIMIAVAAIMVILAYGIWVKFFRRKRKDEDPP